MAAICRGELDIGYPLMHQALQEDIRTSGVQKPKTPAYSFATFDFINPDQAFKDWLDFQAKFLNKCLENYRSSYGKQLQIVEFRERFILHPPNRDTVFLFSYALGRLAVFRIPEFALRNIFAAQLETNLLFNLLLVIDNAIEFHNHGQQYFSMHAIYLSNRAGLSIDQQKLQDQFNNSFRNNPDKTMSDILDGIYQFQDGSVPVGLEKDILVSYGMRNYAAHNVPALQIVWERYAEIRQSLFNVLFLCIEVLF